MNIAVRFATAHDAHTILTFIQALAAHDRESERVTCSAADIEAQLRSASPPLECLLAETGSEVVGIALFQQIHSRWRGRPGILLEQLFVAESHRRQRVGKRLLVELARIALHRGGACLEWRSPNWNEPSTLFSSALGASPMGEWTTYDLSGAPLDALARCPAPGSNESAVEEQALLISEHHLLGSDFTWVASDCTGEMAAFGIDKGGPVPSAVLGDSALMDRAYEALDGLAPCSVVDLAADRQGDTYYSERLAERGIYAFDWHAASDSYVLTARPIEARQVSDLRTSENRQALLLIVLASPFATSAAFSRAALEAALQSARG